MTTNRIFVLLAMAGTFVNTGFAQMSGSGQPKAGSMPGRSASSAVASTNLMGATNMTGGGTGWTNTARMTNLSNPMVWTNRQTVVSPNQPPHATMAPRATGGQMGMLSDIQSMMQKFQADRDAFIAKQKAIETQLKGASEEQRQSLMMQMGEQMQQWKEQHAMIRQQMMDQVEQMKQQMMEQQRLINRAVTPGTGSSQTGNKPGRPTGTGGH